jgi:hypothetical protein
MTATKQLVPVGKRALIQRLNRALAKCGDSGEMLRTPRGEKARQDLGEYYVLDLRHNCVIDKDVDLEEYGRDLGVLKPYEALREEG